MDRSMFLKASCLINDHVNVPAAFFFGKAAAKRLRNDRDLPRPDSSAFNDGLKHHAFSTPHRRRVVGASLGKAAGRHP